MQQPTHAAILNPKASNPILAKLAYEHSIASQRLEPQFAVEFHQLMIIIPLVWLLATRLPLWPAQEAK